MPGTTALALKIFGADSYASFEIVKSIAHRYNGCQNTLCYCQTMIRNRPVGTGGRGGRCGETWQPYVTFTDNDSCETSGCALSGSGQSGWRGAWVGSGRHIQGRYERPHKSHTSHCFFLFPPKAPKINHYLECVFPLFIPNSLIRMFLREDKHRETLEEKRGSKLKKKKRKMPLPLLSQDHRSA